MSQMVDAPTPASEPNRRLTPKRIAPWRIAGTLLSLGLLVYLIARQGWGEFSQAIESIPLTHLLLAFAIVLVSRMFVTLRWYVLLRAAHAQIDFWQTLKLVFTGLFSSNFLPSTVGGDVVRLAGAVYMRLDAGMAAASLLVDRLVGMAGMALMLPAGLAAVTQGGTAGAVLVSAGVGALPWARRLWEKGLAILRSALQSSLYWLRNPKGLALAFVCTFGHMLCTYLTVSVLLRGMGSDLSMWWIGGLWSFSYFVSLAPFTVNGLGLQEVSIAYLYSQFGGVPVEAGLALAVLMRLLPMLASLPGAVFLPMVGRGK